MGSCYSYLALHILLNLRKENYNHSRLNGLVVRFALRDFHSKCARPRVRIPVEPVILKNLLVLFASLLAEHLLGAW